MANSKESINNQTSKLSEQDKIDHIIEELATKVFNSYNSYIADSYVVVPYEKSNMDKTNHFEAFFTLNRLVLEDKKTLEEKLKNVYHFMAYSNNSIALILHRTHVECQLAIAVGIDAEDGTEAMQLATGVRNAFLGNFPGSECGPVVLNYDSGKSILYGVGGNLYRSKNGVTYANSLAVVSNIASKYADDYLDQGIEKMIDGIVPSDDQEYTMVMLANAMNNDELSRKKKELYQNYTDLSQYAKIQENESSSEGTNQNKNGNMGIGIIGRGKNNGTSQSSTTGHSYETTRYDVTHTMDTIEKQMNRLEKCASLGLYEFAAYIFSPNIQLTSEVAHMYMSITQGDESFYETPAINIWNGSIQERRNEIGEIAKYVKHLLHPKFEFNITEKTIRNPGFVEGKVTIASTISGAELALALNIPKKSVPGFSIFECAQFGREISSYDSKYIGNIRLGTVHHMHHDEVKPVYLNSSSLASHTFVTGSTGSGKSNTVYTLLENAKTPFMVIEPTKGEYKYVFGKNAKVYGTNPNVMEMLHINPFAFSDGIHVYEHVDRILDVFNVCWPMYAAMPAVLKDAVITAYEDCGWDMMESYNPNGKVFPTFQDVCDAIDEIIAKSDYSDENKGNYRGSLKTRLKSLTNGINQLMFCNGNLTDHELFDQNVIIDLSRIGSSENKSLVMGLMVIRLQEYRMCSGVMNAPLKHVTVLEEAHNLLRQSQGNSTEGSGELAAKSVEMIANAIAEMRTYGEGFIIVDQAPGLLDMSAIRNTNTKIIMRLPDQSDRELVGKAANLDDKQIAELARLQRGVAAVYQNEWIEPVLCKIDACAHQEGFSYTRNDNRNQEDETAKKIINSSIFDLGYTALHSNEDYFDCLNKVKCKGKMRVQIMDYYRLSVANRDNLWKKVAYEYFMMGDCLYRYNSKITSSEWLDIIYNQLQKFQFASEIEYNMSNPVMYRFVQNMIYMIIVQLEQSNLPQADKVERLGQFMNEYRNLYR